jgi:hypothetical protein
MTGIHPLRALRQTWNDVGTAVSAAVSAAREFRQAGAARIDTVVAANPQNAAIPL